MARILLLANDSTFRENSEVVLRNVGHGVVSASDRTQLRRLAGLPFELLLISNSFPEADASELLSIARSQFAQIVLVRLSHGGSRDVLIELVRRALTSVQQRPILLENSPTPHDRAGDSDRLLQARVDLGAKRHKVIPFRTRR
jgi:DNA-binding NtrC family response regulator